MRKASTAYRNYRASLARGETLFFQAMRRKERHTYFHRAGLVLHTAMATPVWQGSVTLEMQKRIGFQLTPQAKGQVRVQESFELLLHRRAGHVKGATGVSSSRAWRRYVRASGLTVISLAAGAGAGRTEESAKTRTKRALMCLQVTGTLRTVQELRRIANHHQQP